jgi:hypothetical protein
LLLPGVVYYQVVFTLPSELSELALANRHEMADLLVTTAWKSFSQNVRSEQDYDPAAISVLHTWNQKLDAHWHVHMLVPGEGPGISTPGWKKSQAPAESPNSNGHYLVDADRLRDSYRKRAIRRLRRLRADGKLRFGGKFEYLRHDENWEVFVKNLEATKWVAYIQPPPKETSGAGEVVKYLTRYLTGGPISDARIVSANRREVTFLVREGTRAGGERQQVPLKLEIGEFVRRWCLHIQSKQLTKTRYFGGWSNQRLAAYLSCCRERLSSTGRDVTQVPTESGGNESERSTDGPDLACPHCGSDRLELISQTGKPSWKELFWRESETCPPWYATCQRESHRQFWTEAYGSDFYDWYLETQVESAEETRPQSSRPVQLYFTGMTPRVSIEIESF